jgi:hypothetical protein
MAEENNEINFSEIQQEEQEEQEEEREEFESSEESPEVVEVEWEDLEDLLLVRRNFSDNQNLLTDMFLTFERRKQNLLNRLNELEISMNEIAKNLQDKHQLNIDWTYELKLPTQLGEKGYFIRKQD